MSIYTFFKRNISIWNNFKFFWDTPYIWQIIFKAFCSRGTLQINHSYSKTEYTLRQDARAPCDAELWGSERAHAWPCGQKASMESYGRHKPPQQWGCPRDGGEPWQQLPTHAAWPGASAPPHAADELFRAKHRKAQAAVVTHLLLSLQSIGGQRAAGWRCPCHRGGCLPLFSGHPQLAGAAPHLLRKPQLVAAVRFPECVLPLGLSRCQIGSVPRFYLLTFQAGHHYKQLN